MAKGFAGLAPVLAVWYDGVSAEASERHLALKDFPEVRKNAMTMTGHFDNHPYATFFGDGTRKGAAKTMKWASRKSYTRRPHPSDGIHKLWLITHNGVEVWEFNPQMLEARRWYAYRSGTSKRATLRLYAPMASGTPFAFQTIERMRDHWRDLCARWRNSSKTAPYWHEGGKSWGWWHREDFYEPTK